MRSLFKLKKYIAPYLKYILASCILAIPLAAIRAAPAPLVQKFVDEVLIRQDPKRLYIVPAIFIALYFINFFVRFLHYYFIRLATIGVHTSLMKDLYARLLSLTADHYTQQSTGGLISRVAMDPQHLNGGLSSISMLVREPVTFLSLFGYVLYLNWKLTLITVVTFPFFAWILVSAARNVRRYAQQVNQKHADISSQLQENISGIRVVKYFGLENFAAGKFDQEIQHYSETLKKNAKLEEITHPTIDMINAFAIAAVIYFGGGQVLAGTMSQGELISFFTAFAIMADPIRRMNDVNIKINVAAAAAERIFDLLHHWKPSFGDKADARHLSQFNSEVRFNAVDFAYPDEAQHPILKKVSFSLPKGRKIALIGRSGSGKTSLAQLLPRLYDVSGGCITIDGVDIRDVLIKDLRQMISVVSQDVFLFNDTIARNIRAGQLSASHEEVREAAAQANALEFIERLPQGFATQIGDRGQKLSGGERQRISIARAFLRQAPILILDEATSNLDSQSEKAVQLALDKLMANRTTLVIAHRLSTIRNADEIVVLDQGEVCETGKHDELMAKNGVYARLQHLLIENIN